MKLPLYKALAQSIQARKTCKEMWREIHTDRVNNWARERLPSGSGFDSGTTVNLDDSTPNRLVLETAFHHMDEHGGYNGWSEHSIIVTPDLAQGFSLRITGKNPNGIKEYIAECFYSALREEVEA